MNLTGHALLKKILQHKAGATKKGTAMKKTVIAVLLAGATMMGLSTSATAKAETIRFGMEATYPPFEYFDDNNQLTGFDVELARALCAELKATCEFNNQPFDSLIPSLRFRRFDAIISGMDITPARREQVAFSDPYYENSAVFLARKNSNLSDQSSLIGKTVGVQNGSTHQAYLIKELEKKGVKSRSYDNIHNALLDMSNGRVHAVFADTAVANEWLAGHGKGEFEPVGEKVKDPNYFGIGMGIATRLDNPLVEKLNGALAAVKANGIYQTLYTKYFHAEI